MACRVICVSRSLGAGGEEAAHLVANELNFRSVDGEIIIRAADKAGVSPETVEQAEHARPLLTRILEVLAAAPLTAEAGVTMVPPPTYPALNYTELIERVIRETASEGNVVIVAHGASIPLTGVQGVLRVLVTASPKVRAERIAAQTSGDLRAATKAVEESDRERRQFL